MPESTPAPKRARAVVRKYNQGSIKQRIETFFLDNLGKVATRDQIIEVASQGGEEPENWHQRVSELRTDDGYTILSQRDGYELKVGEYLMVDSAKRPKASKQAGSPDEGGLGRCAQKG